MCNIYTFYTTLFLSHTHIQREREFRAVNDLIALSTGQHDRLFDYITQQSGVHVCNFNSTNEATSDLSLTITG